MKKIICGGALGSRNLPHCPCPPSIAFIRKDGSITLRCQDCAAITRQFQGGQTGWTEAPPEDFQGLVATMEVMAS